MERELEFKRWQSQKFKECKRKDQVGESVTPLVRTLGHWEFVVVVPWRAQLAAGRALALLIIF